MLVMPTGSQLRPPLVMPAGPSEAPDGKTDTGAGELESGGRESILAMAKGMADMTVEEGDALWSAVLVAAEVALNEWKAAHGTAESKSAARQSILASNTGGDEASKKGFKVDQHSVKPLKESDDVQETTKENGKVKRSLDEGTNVAWPSILRKRKRLAAPTVLESAA